MKNTKKQQKYGKMSLARFVLLFVVNHVLQERNSVLR